MKTGFDKLDEKINLEESKLIIVGSRPYFDKTSFPLNIAINLALYQNIATLVMSIKESYFSLTNRVIAYKELYEIPMGSEAIVNDIRYKIYNKLVDKKSMENLFEKKIKPEIKKRINLELYIEDNDQPIDNIINVIRQYVQNKNVKIVVIDDLELIENRNREQQISEIVLALKNLAKELNISIILLTNLSRDIEKRDDKRPILSDLRKVLEQNSDIVIFLYRDSYYNRDIKVSERTDVTEIILAKNKCGEIGTVELLWNRKYKKFININ